MPYSFGDTRPIKVLLADFGKKLEGYRLLLNLRQQDVAEAAGVSRITIANLERGRGNLETLARVLRALNLEGRLFYLLPNYTISPIDVRYRRTAAPRQRASPREQKDEGPWK